MTAEGLAPIQKSVVQDAIDAVQKATKASTRKLTASARRGSHNAGWDPEATRSLRVESKDTELWVSGNEMAADEEYGTVDRRPKPAVRQFVNNRDPIDEEIVKQFTRLMGSKL